MTPERFKEIEDAFQRALDLAPLERTAYLDSLRARDPDLHVEVTSLLASEPGAATVLHRTIAGTCRGDG